MRAVLLALAISAAALGGILAFDYLRPGKLIVKIPGGVNAADARQALAARIAQARERSAGVKGLYMTSSVANDRGQSATALKNKILELLETTELNGLVIDVKETEGGAIITETLDELVAGLRRKGIWTIARIAVFKDSSQVRAHPDWYLKRKDNQLWRDNRGGLWLDPAERKVWDYTIAVARQAMEAGFDELQFDYIRFPSDGDTRAIVYPAYDQKRSKPEVMREFFSYLAGALRQARPDIILSADLFGYVALQAEDIGVGQRLEDIGENFDYISLMVYPSHYYGGFEVPADTLRNLPALRYPYRSANVAETAASHPYEVVYRSLLIADDILAGRATSTPSASAQATSTAQARSAADEARQQGNNAAFRRARLRPWLQDFDLAIDSRRKIHYDAAKVRAQIDAAEAAGAAGWLLWSPDNVYTNEALKPE